MSATDWDEETDVLIVGSGAGAMVAAIVAHDQGARPLVIERSDLYGGSSAMSGGGVWVPLNRLMGAIGIEDSSEDAYAYMKASTRDDVPDERVHAFLRHAPDMIDYLCRETRLELVPLEYPDYYPLNPGSRPGGRALEPTHMHARELGREFTKMREIGYQALIAGRVSMTLKEMRPILCRDPGWLKATLGLMAKYWTDLPWRFRSSRDRNLSLGNALVGMLRRSLMDRDIPLWLESPARDLIVEDGKVVGAAIERAGRVVRIRAKRAVFLAAGGFESNQAMREKFLPQPSRVEWTCASPHSQGDAINMGQSLGAGLRLMDDAWWGPVANVPGEALARMLVVEKSLPGGIFVNKKGERFVNESLPYADIVRAIYERNEPAAPCIPAWLVFDASYRRRYPAGPALQSSVQPDWALPRNVKDNFLVRAESLRELADRIGVDPDGLESAVARVNGFARSGTDLDFQRGETSIEKYYGDARVTPNPCLAPLETPPFYAIEVYPGEIGTKGGLEVDEHARVLRDDGSIIDGLYAFGNCSAPVMGRTYPGAGATLASATTFGYIAANHVLQDRSGNAFHEDGT